MSVTNCSQFKKLFNTSASSELQRTHTQIGIIHRGLKDIVNNLFTNVAEAEQKAELISDMFKNNTTRSVFVRQGAIDKTAEKVTFDLTALQSAFRQVCAKQYVDSDDESEEFEEALEDVNAEDVFSILEKEDLPDSPKAEAVDNNPLFQFQMVHTGDTCVALIRAVLDGSYFQDGNRVRYEYPRDAEDLKTIKNFVFLHNLQKRQVTFSPDEKRELSKVSNNWRGIMMHLEELVSIFDETDDEERITRFLHQCMNDGKNVYHADEVQIVTEDEMREIEAFVRALPEGRIDGVFDLSEHSRIFANKLIFALNEKNLYMEFRYKNRGGTSGFRKITQGKAVSYIERAEYHPTTKSLHYRSKTKDDAKGGDGILSFKFM